MFDDIPLRPVSSEPTSNDVVANLTVRRRYCIPWGSVPLIFAVVLPTGIIIGALLVMKDSGDVIKVPDKINASFFYDTGIISLSEEQEGFDTITDTDGDGLLNDEEDDLMTSRNRDDTDEDGLSDGEEMRTFGTDPLNPDTDRDGYADGVEVQMGYDPNGPF